MHLEVCTIRATGAAWTRAKAEKTIAERDVKETMIVLDRDIREEEE